MRLNIAYFGALTLSLALFSQAEAAGLQQSEAAQDCPSAAATEEERVAPRTERERLQRIYEIARTRTLHDAAVANGGVFKVNENLNNVRGRASDLDVLARGSALVVLGTPSTTTVRFAPNGRMLYTYYDIVVAEVLKGEPVSSVLVKLPGGTIRCSDGSVVEVGTPGVNIRQDNRYLMFLQPTPTGVGTDPNDLQLNAFRPVGSAQGIFEIASGRVTPLARPMDTLYQLYNGVELNVFLAKAKLMMATARSK